MAKFLPDPKILLKCFPIKPKVIITDVDGTFLGEHLRLHPKTLKAYQIAKEHGFQIFLATGRSRIGLKMLFESYKVEHIINLNPGIYLNGALVYGYPKDGADKILYEATLDKELVKKAIHTVEKINEQMLKSPQWMLDSGIQNAPAEHGFLPVKDCSLRKVYIDYAIYSRDNLILTSKNALNDGFKQYKEGVYTHCDSPLDFVESNTVNKFTIFSHNKQIIDQWRKNIVELAGNSGTVTSSVNRMMEIIPSGTNKGNQLELLLKEINCNLSESVSIGDAENDKEMLIKAPLSFAMPQATEAVKRSAKYTIPPRELYGWSSVVNLLIDTYCYPHPP